MGKPKSVKAPSLKKAKPPPIPAPVAIPEVATETADETIKQALRASGFKKTFLTGNLTPNTGKKKILGL